MSGLWAKADDEVGMGPIYAVSSSLHPSLLGMNPFFSMYEDTHLASACL